MLATQAKWLVEEERYREIAPVATRAIRLARTPEGRFWTVPAIAALADADRRLGRSHARAAELAEDWAARLPGGLFQGWMLRQRGLSLVRMGRASEGAELVARSAEVDLGTGQVGVEPWAYHATTLGEAYLEAGEPRRAAALLRGRRERGFDWWTLVRVEHANGRAATEAEMAYLRFRATEETPSPLKRRRLAGIERRQAWLTRGRPVVADPAPADPGAEDRLWAAVLRENAG